MHLWSEAWHNGEPLPPRFAAGWLDAGGRWQPADNLSPPLRWGGLPAGSRSLALLCHDFDATAHVGSPTQAEAEPTRGDFFHWVLVDLSPHCGGLGEGQWRQGFCPGGQKPPAQGPASGPRQGLNDFGRWFDGRAGLAGQYMGYDGPCRVAQDPVVHHLLFTLYALDLEKLALPWPFTGAQAIQALVGHVLASATLSATWSAYPQLTPTARAVGPQQLPVDA